MASNLNVLIGRLDGALAACSLLYPPQQGNSVADRRINAELRRDALLLAQDAARELVENYKGPDESDSPDTGQVISKLLSMLNSLDEFEKNFASRWECI